MSLFDHGGRRRALALTLAGATALSLGTAGTASAVTLSTAKARPVQIAGAGPATPYTTAETVWIECPRGGTPLMTGWSGVSAPISIVYSNNLVSSRTLGLGVRRPLEGGTLRATALCAEGPVAARTKESSSGTVSCSNGQLAIGVPIDGGPYWTRAVASMPVGTRGWRNSEGGYARAKVICVAASAFRAVKTVTKRASLPAGARSATVTARCAGGSRPIGWGFEAGLLDGNRWSSPDSGVSNAVPYVASAKASGRAGWSLTFATPDGRRAAAAAPIVLGVTCAAPR